MHRPTSFSLSFSLEREGDTPNRLSRLFGLTSSWSLSSFSPTRQQDLPACLLDTSERIGLNERTNERVRQTVNGSFAKRIYLRSGSWIVRTAGIKESRRRRRAAPPLARRLTESREIERRTESSYFKHTPRDKREETVIGIHIYCLQGI